MAPYSANLLEDRIVLDADFNFSNNKNENLNVQHVIAKQMYIKANGEIGWHKTGFFVWTNFVGVTSKYEWRAIEQQQTGNFGGFVYKVNSLGIGYSGNGQYHFATRGNIVLEEHSLSTKNFDVQISYNQNNFKNRINDKTLTASTQKHLPDGATNLITPATGIEIQPQGVKTEYHDGSMDMVVEVKYFKNDATYGNGFKTESEVTMKVPVVRAVYSKTLIGKSIGFNYWYVQGKYKDDAGIPTGILDLVAYEFDGRFYYNMNHKTEVKNLSDNSYTPDNNIGLGLFALTKIKSGASDGAVINATGAIKVETGSKAATFYCDAEMLNEDLATNISMIDGDGVIQWSFSPLFIDGNIRVKQSLFGIFGGADVTAHLFLDPSTLSLDVAAPMHVNYINVNANVNPQYYTDNENPPGTCVQYDGFTKTLIAKKTGLIPCQTYTLRLAIADAGDGSFDSGVLISMMQFESGRAVSVVCLSSSSSSFSSSSSSYSPSMIHTTLLNPHITTNKRPFKPLQQQQ